MRGSCCCRVGWSSEGGGREALKQRLAAGDGTIPPRAVQEAALRTSAVNPLDVLVIGGATGCGVALDASTRGLRVGLVEREDFAAGTSSRSTKLIHGGVRYLEKAVFQLDYGQLRLVFHALEERARLIQNAPHLCHPLPTMTPCYEWWEIPYYWSGLKLYDLVAGRQMLHFSQSAHGKTLKGTVVYYDGQMDDSRVNVSLACTAALTGAAVLNHAEAIAVQRDEVTNRVTNVRVRDNLTGKEFDVHTKVVDEKIPIITPSSGVHIVLPDYYSADAMGLIVPKTKDGRVVFMLPWLGRTLAGTTDSSTKLTMYPEPQEEEIQFILDAISDYLAVKVRRLDVLSAWSGIRPLASNPSVKDTANISRDHVVHIGSDGMVTITGGKWTTYRSMAEDAVDAAIKFGDLTPANACVTKDLPLIGGEDWDPSFFTILAQQFVRMKITHEGKIVPGVMDTLAAKHLAHAFGSMSLRVALIAQNENLGKRLAHGYPYLEAEVAYCARNEYCESAVDFIARRSRIAFLDTNAASKAVPRVIEILAQEHKWDIMRKKQELEKARAFLETFKSSKNAQFDDSKHNSGI
ncbi:hypothetical protein O6H91_11G011700 [Diphasiastrum complanatum]|uniref:Uncharacterized protein n=1 Tax=Diphasiastrum complanatum TaxID=34168 RepID=A0ACC2C6Q1_DIPCM|nr:hypothetical protein O6H91_11G011700 [Diphasiastrum complanatum]